MAVIERIDWGMLDRLVEAQQRNRETYSPVVSLFRWWARRPHAVAGSLLDAAIAAFGNDSFVVADPFSGGGTVAFEAVRRGLTVYAQDLYPWPSLGLAISLAQADVKELARAGEELLDRLSPYRALYQSRNRTHELTHIIRVRVARCKNCGGAVHLFRESFVSLASRKEGEGKAFFGCEACGTATLRHAAASSFRCDACDRRSAVRTSEGYSPKPEV